MKVEIAVHTLLSVLLTFAMVWWLYPLNPTAIGIVFVMSTCVVVICIYTIRKLVKYIESGDICTPNL